MGRRDRERRERIANGKEKPIARTPEEQRAEKLRLKGTWTAGVVEHA